MMVTLATQKNVLIDWEITLKSVHTPLTNNFVLHI